MKRTLKNLVVVAVMLFGLQYAFAGRVFVHPGISYTQADIDRMRSLIAAKQEPYYSAFVALKNSSYSSTSAGVSQRGTQIKEGKFNGRSAFLAAGEGDETAKAVVENYIKHLAVGVANIINIFQPEIFVIGGGVANEGDNLIKPLTKMVFSQTYTNPNIVPMCDIVKAKLGNDAGIIGAALLK